VPSNTANTQALVVDGTFNTINRLYTSVTVCKPGTASCQTIDHVVVDTGSSGLRLLSSALTLAGVPQLTSANGAPVTVCQQFVTSYTYGSARKLDIRMAGELAGNQTVQLMSDPAYATVPSTCAQGGSNSGTVAALGGNGILGVANSPYDCGSLCANTAYPATYYQCPSGASSCTATSMALASQLQNPVFAFATDNNGLILKLDAPPYAGASSIGGQLVFGLDTQANNASSAATQLVRVSEGTGFFTTVYGGSSYVRSFFDTGSQEYYFRDGSLPVDGNGEYAPSAGVLNTSATNVGGDNRAWPTPFSVANWSTLNSSSFVYGNIGAPISFASGAFDWGLPFFLGKRVWYGFEQRSSLQGNGPWVGY
jgi:hypothetical protein